MRPRPAMIHLVRPDVLLEIFRRIEHRPGFEESDIDAKICQDLHDSPAAGARPDDNHVVHLGTSLNLKH